MSKNEILKALESAPLTAAELIELSQFLKSKFESQKKHEARVKTALIKPGQQVVIRGLGDSESLIASVVSVARGFAVVTRPEGFCDKYGRQLGKTVRCRLLSIEPLGAEEGVVS